MREQLKSLDYLTSEMIEDALAKDKILTEKCGDKKYFTLKEAMEYTNFNKVYDLGLYSEKDYYINQFARKISELENNKKGFNEYFKLAAFVVSTTLEFDPEKDSFLDLYQTHYERFEILLLQINLFDFFVTLPNSRFLYCKSVGQKIYTILSTGS